MNAYKNIYILLLLFIIILLNSCSIIKTVPEGKYLLTKYKINVDNKNFNTDDLHYYVKPKPNRKILLFYSFHLRAYNFGERMYDPINRKTERSERRIERKKERKRTVDNKKEEKRRKRSFKRWLQETVGEPPVILDTLLVENTERQLKIYLNSIGFFNAEVSSKTDYYKKKKARVNYNIITNEAYTINKISYSIKEDPMLKAFIYANKNECLLKKGDNFNVDLIEDERDRITEMLKNRGYYDFSKKYIIFNIDTTIGNHQLDINIAIHQIKTNLVEFPDSVSFTNHKRSKIKNIYIYPEFKPIISDSIRHDTMRVIITDPAGKLPESTYYFLYTSDKLKIKPKTITQSIYIISDQHFKLIDIEQTQKSLAELGIFKYINIKFEKTPQDSLQQLSQVDFLDCKICLSRTKIGAINLETEGTNTGNDLGIAGNIIYSNKNLFRGGEIFKIKLSSAIEIQQTKEIITDEENIIPVLPFNTFTAGLQASVDIPRFLIPIKQERFPKYFKPKTNLMSGFNFERRPNYTRIIGNTTFGYRWKPSVKTQHIFNPAEINIIKISPDSTFEAKINDLSPGLRSSYRDHLITGLGYSFIASNQSDKKRNFNYLRANIKTAGNGLRIGNIIFNSAKTNKRYRIFDIMYAQFIKTDIDYRFYHTIRKNEKIVFRIATGFGFSYGNSFYLPFEEAFSIGGSNSIRAWQFRTLGPGSYSDDEKDNFDKSGDIIFETNLEYRFPIISVVEGALYIDAGNIWTLDSIEQFSGGQFKTDEFINEIAVGTGLGLRLNFGFFIIRLDSGIKIFDPSFPKGSRYVLNKVMLNNMNYNIGIGYPF